MTASPALPTAIAYRPDADPLLACLGHLDYLIWAWPDLVTFRLHGTERPWSEEAAVAGHERDAREAAARIERLERIGLAPGERPVPLRVDVLDLLHRVVHVVSDVARALADVLPVLTQPHVAPALDARPWLLHVRDLLPCTQTFDDRCSTWVVHQLDPLVTAVARILGDVLEGQVLAALCPWCGGRGPDGLEGTRTLRVHYPDHGSAGHPVVACHGLGCDPPQLARADRSPDGAPTWNQGDWPWLAHKLEPLHESRDER